MQKINPKFMNIHMYKKVGGEKSNIMTDRSIKDKICTQIILIMTSLHLS